MTVPTLTHTHAQRERREETMENDRGGENVIALQDVTVPTQEEEDPLIGKPSHSSGPATDPGAVWPSEVSSKRHGVGRGLSDAC